MYTHTNKFFLLGKTSTKDVYHHIIDVKRNGTKKTKYDIEPLKKSYVCTFPRRNKSFNSVPQGNTSICIN